MAKAKYYGTWYVIIGAGHILGIYGAALRKEAWEHANKLVGTNTPIGVYIRKGPRPSVGPLTLHMSYFTKDTEP